jgi:hypothetical protein
MDAEAELENGSDIQFCPKCGAGERGFFCHACGTLLRGDEMILCPRCHHVVPDGEFCNQCGQNLAGIALNLKQLALAGDDFWVTASTLAGAGGPAEGLPGSLLEPDESVVLAEGDLPEWLDDLSMGLGPAVGKAHVYPSLRPIEAQVSAAPRSLWIGAIVMLGLILLSLVFVAIILLSRGLG